LCEEFSFSEFPVNLSELFQLSNDSQRRQIGSPLARIRNALLSESFQFVVDGALIEIEIAEGAALFPTVPNSFPLMDACDSFL
jgi:hypothetical protein